MKIRTKVKAGQWSNNHSPAAPKPVKIKAKVRAGQWANNHNQVVRTRK